MKLLRNILLLAGLLLGGRLGAVGQAFDWAKLAHNKNSNFGFCPASCTDRAGNTYAFVGFTDTLRVGTVVVRAAGGGTGGRALVRLDSLGQVVWVKLLRGLTIGYRSITPDPLTGGVFFSAYAYTGATWGGAALPNGVSRNFLAKCSATGTLTWAVGIPGDPNTYATLAADGLGSLYAMGSTSINRPLTNSVGFINGVRIDTTRSYLLRLTTTGVVQWVRLLHGTPKPYSNAPYNLRIPDGLVGYRLAGRPGGGCLVYGAYLDSLYFNNAPILASRTGAPLVEDSYLAHIMPTGTLAWVRPGGLGGTATTPVPQPGDVVVDQPGNYYVTGNSSRGIGVAKYADSGAVVWAQNQEPATTRTGALGVGIAIDDRNAVTVLAVTNNYPTDPPTVFGNYVLRNAYSIIHFEPTGQLTWAQANGISTQPPMPDFFYYDPTSLGVDGPGNVYLAAETGSASLRAARSRVPPVVQLGSFTVVGGGVVMARIGSRHNTVRGRLYLDANGNGRRDATEGPFPQTLAVQVLQPTYNPLGTMEANGYFNVYTGAGAYSLPAPVPPLHYALTQPNTGPYTGSFVGYGRIDTARHFGYRPIANQADVRVTLTPYGVTRVGVPLRHRLTVENVGTTTVASGTASATLDSRMQYISSAPAGSRTGQTVTWNYTNLAPFARRNYDITFSLPINTPLGTQLTSTAAAPLAGDVVPADNSTTAQQTVVGSFDPNDIQVNYSRLTPAQVAAGLPLDYTVRFQNMGSDTAFAVVIQDTLNFRKLNLGTLQMVAQSHNCSWSLSGQGLLTIRFLSIKLPERNVDVIRSQGFVRFRVLPKSSLVLGDIIPNRAHIFFDFNAPVRTNIATTTVLAPSALLQNHAALAWDTYPNPAQGLLHIAAELPSAGSVTLQLFDGLGRPVQQHTLVAPAGAFRQALDVSPQAPGLYVLRLRLPDGTVLTRQVVRE